MAGIALGSWLAMRSNNSSDAGAEHPGTHGGSDSARARRSGPAAGGQLDREFYLRRQPWIAAQVIFPALAALAGMLGGYQFVVAAGIFLRGRGQRRGLGVLYAIDLLGGCAGALALSGFLIPVYGFWKTAWLVAGINLAAMLLAARTRVPANIIYIKATSFDAIIVCMEDSMRTTLALDDNLVMHCPGVVGHSRENCSGSRGFSGADRARERPQAGSAWRHRSRLSPIFHAGRWSTE